MEESRQPTHHGYAVNVKDYGRYDVDHGPLTDEEVDSIYQCYVEDFWDAAREIAQSYGVENVYGEGRSSGWLTPQPQPKFDDLVSAARWMRDIFRPLERDVLEVMEEIREEFLAELKDAVSRANAEPAERAYWEARDTVTVD